MKLPAPAIGRLSAPARLIVSAFFLLAVTSSALPQTTNAQAAYEQAIQLLQSGKTADALTSIDAAIAAGARDPSLYNLKGLAASELGRDAEAEQSFRTVIQLSPQSAMGYTNLGVLLSKLGRNQEAANAFREGLQRDPKSFTALLGLGETLAALQKYDEAASYLQKARSVRPGDFQAGYEWAHALLEAKQPGAAKKALTQVTAPSEPQLALKYYSLAGVIAETSQDSAGAAQSYRQAYALDPHSYEIYLALLRASLSTEGTPSEPLPLRRRTSPQHKTLPSVFSLSLTTDTKKQSLRWKKLCSRTRPTTSPP